jgi:hypothetical protein
MLSGKVPEFWGIFVFDNRRFRSKQTPNEYGRNCNAIEITLPSDLTLNRFNNRRYSSAILAGITEMPVSRLSILR